MLVVVDVVRMADGCDTQVILLEYTSLTVNCWSVIEQIIRIIQSKSQDSGRVMKHKENGQNGVDDGDVTKTMEDSIRLYSPFIA